MLRHHEWFEPHELERRLQIRVASHVPDGGRTAPHAPGLVLVHVHPHVKRFRATEQHQGRRRGRRWSKLPDAYFDLQHVCGHRRADDTAIEIHVNGLDLGFGGGHLGARLFEFSRRRFDGRTTPRQLLGADGALVLHLLGKLELPLEVGGPSLGHPRPGARDVNRLLPHGQLRPELSRIQFEQSIAGLDALARRHQDSRHDTRERGANPDVFSAGFDQTHSGDRVCEVGHGRRRGRVGRRSLGLRPHDRVGCPHRGKNPNEWQDEAFHA